MNVALIEGKLIGNAIKEQKTARGRMYVGLRGRAERSLLLGKRCDTQGWGMTSAQKVDQVACRV